MGGPLLTKSPDLSGETSARSPHPYPTGLLEDPGS